ncbi:0d52555a-b56d-42bc-a31a-1772494bb005 [Sclerotinia trifoliorum]|uniref:0d52555a-b56d-42bc-a31a-1772494bb005 n=1 Tax=Sclerotinia trifoliorum TaxID=28548 RepID=A0A8H2W3V2_9HELO|nr:0d52555a-b56d-42bc-a31a-1772494bb005 [Sclerotinia trifoliorum]
MVLICPRIHFFEINDQPWFPQYLREKVQSCLTLCWTFRVPIIQPSSPAQLVATTLSRTLSDKVTSYTYVDFCAGAGGPTPYIEVYMNEQLNSSTSAPSTSSNPSKSSSVATPEVSYAEIAAAPKDEINGLKQRSSHLVNADDKHAKVQFVLTDLHPHIPDWTEASKRSENLNFISESVDAANAPRNLLKNVNGVNGETKVFRLYNLAFHHFDDGLGSKILKNTVETADGFGIFELQERTLSSLITMFAMGIMILGITPFYFWRSPGHLFFTYIIPIIPFVLVFDGIISSLRTRSAEEVEALMRGSGVDTQEWKVSSGRERHTWPTGYMTWVMGIKE